MVFCGLLLFLGVSSQYWAILVASAHRQPCPRITAISNMYVLMAGSGLLWFFVVYYGFWGCHHIYAQNSVTHNVVRHMSSCMPHDILIFHMFVMFVGQNGCKTMEWFIMVFCGL